MEEQYVIKEEKHKPHKKAHGCKYLKRRIYILEFKSRGLIKYYLSAIINTLICLWLSFASIGRRQKSSYKERPAQSYGPWLHYAELSSSEKRSVDQGA